MKRLVLATLVALVATASAFANVVYVKPAASGTGDGSSWANAMGSVSNALIHALKTDAPREIRMSKGIHKWNQCLQIGANRKGIYDPEVSGSYAFSIRGGFVGVSEDETADNAANPTYLSCDVKDDDRWIKRSLSTLTTTGSSTTTDCGLIVDGGGVVWPDDSDDADALYAPDANKVSDNVAFLDLTDNRGVVVEFSDFTVLGAGATGTFLNLTGSGGCKLTNIVFLGPCVKATLTAIKSPLNSTVFENVKTLWAYTKAPIWGMGGLSGSSFKGMDVKGVCYDGTCQKGAIFSCGGDGVSAGFSFKDCTVEKCYASQSHSYNAASIVFGFEKATQMTITNCVFRRICSRGNSVAAVLSTRPSGSGAISKVRVVDCLFENNVSYTTASTGAIDNFGIVALAAEDCSLEGCAFKDNRCIVKPTGSATAARAGVVTVTSSIHASETAAPHRLLVNCTFSGNTVEADTGSNSNETTPRTFARSVLVSSLANGKPLDVVVADCTFAGTTSAEPDVSWTGLDSACKVRVLNSIFNGDAVGYVPVASSASGVMSVENSLLNGCTALPSVVSGSGNVFSGLPLGDWEDLDGVRVAPVRRPAARFPALRSAVRLGRFQKENATYLTDANGNHVYASSTVVIPATVEPLADALGAERPSGNATIGAVQELTAAAENGATLHLSASPAEAGSLTGGGTIQVVEKGAGVVSVTAVSSDPSKYSFVAWKTSDDTVYSTSAELTISALNEDLQLTAVFSAPKTKYTFDLQGAGTFSENNQSVIVKELDAGAVLTVPAFTIDEEHYQPVGWNPTPPEKVGASDQTFSYVTITKIHRILRVDLNLAEGGDGSSWANAMTNIQEAIDKAAIWTGEVWIRQGVHRFAKAMADKLTMANNVAIFGGFEGMDGKYADTAAERAARDPKLYPSVISADIAGDDPWMKNGTAMTAQKVVVDGRIVYPEFESGKITYGVSLYYPNAYYIFDNSDLVLDETAVLDGVTLLSPITSALNNGDRAVPTVRNCTFVGGGAKSATWLSVSNCTFTAVSGVALTFVGGTAEGAHGVVQDCVFRYCNCGNSGKGVFAFSSQNAFFELRNCLFDQCTGNNGLNYYLATVIGTEWGKGLICNTTVRNCWTSSGSVLLMTPYAGCVVSNCLFECNEAVQNASGAAVSTGDLPYVLMRNAQSAANAAYYNTTFRSNVVSRTVGDHANSKDGNAAVLEATGKLLLVNCTFDGNTVTCTSPLAAYPATASVLLAPRIVNGSNASDAYCGVVHSAFNGNTAADGDMAFVNRVGTSAVSYVVNSLFDGGAGHQAITGSGVGAQVKVYNSVVQDLAPASSVISESTGNVVASPQLTRKWRGAEPIVAKRVAGGSPAQNLGRNVYVDGGVVCVPTDAEETTFVNAATGAAVTPSADKAMLTDVFGLERPAGKVTAGALQETGGGFTVLVR